jgi:AAA family ATP:ADP antiporter
MTSRSIRSYLQRLREHPLELALSAFAEVREGEGPTALLLTLNVFLLLTAYYLLKVAREPLILLGGGAEVKSYASIGQSALLVPATAIYGWLAARVGRMALIAWVTLFFALDLVVFWALGARGVPLGVPFFLWVGIFNVTTVAQFWSFAADIYSEEQGKRLFAIIGIGSSVGAVAGAWTADALLFLGPFRLMLVAAGILLLCLGLTWVTHRRESGHARSIHKGAESAPLGGADGFSLVLRDRYLLLFAGLIFVLNWVTKTGDYVLDRKLLATAHDALQTHGQSASAFVAQFKARYFEWVNGVGVALQLFAVSRVIKYLGLRAALVIMPVASLAGYSSAFAAPLLGVLFVARVVESSLDYSLSNTTRQALWLPTSRDAKYKAKQVIDTFVVRAGDVMSALLVWLGSRAVLSDEGFLGVNLVLSGVWLAFALLLGRSYLRVSAPHLVPAPVPVPVHARSGGT